jgi:flagellar basal body-associated protein FliL
LRKETRRTKRIIDKSKSGWMMLIILVLIGILVAGAFTGWGKKL